MSSVQHHAGAFGQLGVVVRIRHQHFCRNCGKQTLHELDPDPVNQVFHLLLTLFACGCWLPMWILLNLTKPPQKMRCLQCGQAADEPTERGELLEEDERKRAARIRYAIEWEKAQAKNLGESSTSESGNGSAHVAEKVIDFAKVPVHTALLGVRQADAGLKRLVGDDIFALWIFRSLVVVCMTLVTSLVAFLAFRVLEIL